jgi:hypothetical protein
LLHWGPLISLGANRRYQADVPGQQLCDAVDRVIGDAAEHLAQVGFGIEAVELGAFNKGVDRGGALATGIGAGEQIILPRGRANEFTLNSFRWL